jgi:hypothetical protein
VPPDTETVADPLFPPLHDTFVCAAMDAITTAGSVIITDAVPVYPLKSLTVTV